MKKADLTILQRLDLYQIIAYAKEGKTDQVIDRAQQMLSEESLVTLSPEQWRVLGEMTPMEIALGALAFRDTVVADIERSQSAVRPDAA